MRIHEGKFEENKKNSRYAVLDSEPAVKQLEQKEQSDLQKWTLNLCGKAVKYLEKEQTVSFILSEWANAVVRR